MSEAEKDTREWVIGPGAIPEEGPPIKRGACVEVVPKVALSAAEVERDKAQARVLALESQGAVTVVANPLRERAERAEAALAEALSELEECRERCKYLVDTWNC